MAWKLVENEKVLTIIRPILPNEQ